MASLSTLTSSELHARKRALEARIPQAGADGSYLKDASHHQSITRELRKRFTQQEPCMYDDDGAIAADDTCLRCGAKDGDDCKDVW
jgi:hypothetical protein